MIFSESNNKKNPSQENTWHLTSCDQPRSVCSFQATQPLMTQLQYYTVPSPANDLLAAMNALLNSGGA